MDLYINPVATTSRAVMALCQAESIPVNLKIVDLMAGEHHQPPFCELNPNRLVPVLDDEGFVLTEASAILRYLATQRGSRLYPAEPKERARVDELISWFDTNFYRDFGYQYVYPQLFPHHARPSEEANRQTVQWGRDKSRVWLSVLDGHFLAGRQFVASDRLTIADYLGVSILSLGDLIGCDFAGFPNVQRWYAQMNADPHWVEINGAFCGFAASLRGREFVGL